MARPQRSKALSSGTKALLRSGEGQLVDFKRTSDGISVEDLVSFANAVGGGTILAGVEEAKNPDGSQLGFVCGCDVSDASILQVLNKAISCLPPVSVTIYLENLSENPILRVEIPSSSSRPHSTSKGIYCVRDGTRNRPLHPNELLAIFLDKEASVFTERFDAVSQKLSFDIEKLESELSESIESMGAQLGWAEYKIGDTESTLDSILAYVRQVKDTSADASERLRALFRQDARQDPVKDRARQQFFDAVLEQFRGDKKLLKAANAGERMSVTASGKASQELVAEDLQAVVREVIEMLNAEKSAEKHT